MKNQFVSKKINENDLYLVREYNFDNLLYSEMYSVLDICFTDRHNNYFHKNKYECIYDINFKKIANSEMINFTVNGKNMDLYHLNTKLKIAQEKRFIFFI